MSTEKFDRIAAIAGAQPESRGNIDLARPERDLLAVQLRAAVELIEGPLVGAAWKRECRDFCDSARALLARIKG